MSTVEERLEALERAVAQLRAPEQPAPAGGVPDTWLVDELLRRHPNGAVAYAGHATIADGPVAWQIETLSEALLEASWDDAATPLAALAHPVRLRLLQLVLNGHRTTAELADDEELGTTGQLHHHLRALTAAGWLQSTGRGRYAVPAGRVVPLLVIVSAVRP